MAKIFISYARKDKDEVYPIVDELERNGFDCWIDKKGIESGSEFESVILDAIDSCEVFLHMLSVNSKASSYVREEYKYAVDVKKKVVSIALKGSMENPRVMFGFNTKDLIDISNKDQKEKLIRDLKKWVGDSSIKTPTKTVSESIENIKVKTTLSSFWDFLFEDSNKEYEVAATYNRDQASGQENYIKGVKLYEQGDYQNAIIFLKKAAVEQEYLDAQNKLGLCYQYGRGVKQDYNQAFYWYRRAANQGNADAQNHLGDCYHYGRGTEQNYRQAVAWYRKAAEQGNADAQYNLKSKDFMYIL